MVWSGLENGGRGGGEVRMDALKTTISFSSEKELQDKMLSSLKGVIDRMYSEEDVVKTYRVRSAGWSWACEEISEVGDNLYTTRVKGYYKTRELAEARKKREEKKQSAAKSQAAAVK